MIWDFPLYTRISAKTRAEAIAYIENWFKQRNLVAPKLLVRIGNPICPPDEVVCPKPGVKKEDKC